MCTFKIQDMVLDDENPWDRILVPNTFALHVTVHTTTRHAPAQLIFGRDSILNARHEENSNLLRNVSKT